LQTDAAKAKQCQFSQSTFCYPVPALNKKDIDEQRDQEIRANQEKRTEYARAQKQKSFDECMRGCDAWFHLPNLPKPNAACKAGCLK